MSIEKLRAALVACVEQIDQMKGMFPDNDGTIAQALGDAAAALADVAADDEQRAKKEKDVDNARNEAKAQIDSIIAFVAAMECDYDRLDELREMKRPWAYVSNQPGYMPDNEPTLFETRQDAMREVARNIGEAADRLEENCEQLALSPEQVEELRERAAAMRKHAESLLVSTETGEYGITLEGWHHSVVKVDRDGLDEDDYEELKELEEAAGEFTSSSDARDRLLEDALEVQVRSDWRAAGDDHGDASEFYILLCTGGPAVRIRGMLDRGQVTRAWVEYQDWFTPWTEYHGENANHEAILTYCNQHYFGE